MAFPNRRHILGGGAALAARAAFPAAALHPQRRHPSDVVHLGLIGVGIRGRNLMNGSFLKNAGFRMRAVCDVVPERAQDGKRIVDAAYGDSACDIAANHRALLARDDIDAVVIATPDHWHANQVIDTVVAGKDVYCEKPLTRTLGEARAVVEAVRKHGRVFQTGSQQRCEYQQRFIRAAELVRAGRIGQVLNVNVGVGNPTVPCQLPEEQADPGVDWDRWLGPAQLRPYHSILCPRGVHNHYPRWRDYAEYAGGGLADMGAHHFDIVQWALGMDDSGPVRTEPPEDPEAKRGASLIYDGGIRVTHGGPSGATFVGTKGILAVDRGRIDSVPAKLLEEELPEEQRLPRHAGHAANWLACIHDRSQPICHAEIGARSVAICHLLNLTYRHHQALEWDPANWTFNGPEEATGWLEEPEREGYERPAF
jgi:predicted dehydrogenase